MFARVHLIPMCTRWHVLPISLHSIRGWQHNQGFHLHKDSSHFIKKHWIENLQLKWNMVFKCNANIVSCVCEILKLRDKATQSQQPLQTVLMVFIFNILWLLCWQVFYNVHVCVIILFWTSSVHTEIIPVTSLLVREEASLDFLFWHSASSISAEIMFVPPPEGNFYLLYLEICSFNIMSYWMRKLLSSEWNLHEIITDGVLIWHSLPNIKIAVSCHYKFYHFSY